MRLSHEVQSINDSKWESAVTEVAVHPIPMPGAPSLQQGCRFLRCPLVPNVRSTPTHPGTRIAAILKVDVSARVWVPHSTSTYIRGFCCLWSIDNSHMAKLASLRRAGVRCARLLPLLTMINTALSRTITLSLLFSVPALPLSVQHGLVNAIPDHHCGRRYRRAISCNSAEGTKTTDHSPRKVSTPY